ncbi:MAG: hypothetical protein AAF197_09775 [Pseudomonadota bacterium]
MRHAQQTLVHLVLAIVLAVFYLYAIQAFFRFHPIEMDLWFGFFEVTANNALVMASLNHWSALLIAAFPIAILLHYFVPRFAYRLALATALIVTAHVNYDFWNSYKQFNSQFALRDQLIFLSDCIKFLITIPIVLWIVRNLLPKKAEY